MNKLPIAKTAVKQRIARALAKDGKKLIAALDNRPDASGIEWIERKKTAHCVIDTASGTVESWHYTDADLEALAREIGALKSHEVMQ